MTSTITSERCPPCGALLRPHEARRHREACRAIGRGLAARTTPETCPHDYPAPTRLSSGVRRHCVWCGIPEAASVVRAAFGRWGPPA